MDDDRLKVFQDSIGLFAIIDYTTPNGITTAKGKLISISDNGNVLIQHLDNPQISWGFNIEDVGNYKFSPIKERRFKNGF